MVVIDQIGPWHLDCVGQRRKAHSAQSGRCDISLNAGNLDVRVVRSRTGAVITARIVGCAAATPPAVLIDEASLEKSDGAFRFHHAIVAAANRNYPQCRGKGFILAYNQMTISTVLSMTRPELMGRH